MKKPLTSKTPILYITHEGNVYAIPFYIAQNYQVETQEAKLASENKSADEVFSAINKKHSKAGALLKGLRARENLSQIDFAKKISVTQANLSKMENGKRPIGKTVAKRIAAVFAVDYRYFLE
jgi:DNA-binding XRE family transcriptional regulator